MTRTETLIRYGALLCVLAFVPLNMGGCIFPISDACTGVDTDDGDPCTADACAVTNGQPVVSNTPIANCCEIAADCNDDNSCTTDACTQIDATTGAGTCAHVSIGSDCCSDDSDCGAGNVCTNGNCVADNTNDNGNGNDNTNGNDNGNTNGNDNGNGGTGDAQAGQTFYTANGCAGCHGADASGGVGPNIQGESADEIFSALTGGSHPITISTLTEQQAADLAAYLATF